MKSLIIAVKWLKRPDEDHDDGGNYYRAYLSGFDSFENNESYIGFVARSSKAKDWYCHFEFDDSKNKAGFPNSAAARRFYEAVTKQSFTTQVTAEVIGIHQSPGWWDCGSAEWPTNTGGQDQDWMPVAFKIDGKEMCAHLRIKKT